MNEGPSLHTRRTKHLKFQEESSGIHRVRFRHCFLTPRFLANSAHSDTFVEVLDALPAITSFRAQETAPCLTAIDGARTIRCTAAVPRTRTKPRSAEDESTFFVWCKVSRPTAPLDYSKKRSRRPCASSTRLAEANGGTAACRVRFHRGGLGPGPLQVRHHGALPPSHQGVGARHSGSCQGRGTARSIQRDPPGGRHDHHPQANLCKQLHRELQARRGEGEVRWHRAHQDIRGGFHAIFRSHGICAFRQQYRRLRRKRRCTHARVAARHGGGSLSYPGDTPPQSHHRRA